MEQFDAKLHEECGVFGVLTRSHGEDVVPMTYRALYALQHRGQESCGIAINDDGVITGYKDVGLVNDVFTEDVMRRLPRGEMAIGHCRYGTTGGRTRENAQPIVIRHIKGGMALAHNGNLTNASELREELEQVRKVRSVQRRRRERNARRQDLSCALARSDEALEEDRHRRSRRTRHRIPPESGELHLP